MIKKQVLYVLIVLFFCGTLAAQSSIEQQLANQYIENGEYEKAIPILEKLQEADIKNGAYYPMLFKCYSRLKEYEKAENYISKRVKKTPAPAPLYVDLGYIYNLKKDTAKAVKQYEKAIKELRAEPTNIQQTAESFKGYGLANYMVKTYETGNELLKSDDAFSFDLATGYLALKDYKKSVTTYLSYLQRNPQSEQYVKNIFQSQIENKSFTIELQTQLYSYLQKKPDEAIWNNLMLWLAIQQRDFEEAITQAKALDKLKNENGYRVLDVARLAKQELFYKDAIQGFEYIFQKGKSNPLYATAQMEILSTRKIQIEKSVQPAVADILALKNQYHVFLTEHGKNAQTAEVLIDLAELEANYIYNLDSAINILNALLEMPSVPSTTRSKAKLNLGDYYVMNGEVWEAMLIYGQVDKAEKDSPLGEEARFKNARLFYFNGEFELAQSQMEVLKSATSELIANDALNLSVFIIENLGLDSNTTPMELYAAADLLLLQNKLADAKNKLDTIYKLYPGHKLTDDVYFSNAKICIKQKEYSKSLEYLDLIQRNFKQDILADDAVFMSAQIQEEQLKNTEKAKELYKAILTDYPDSVYVIEARKRYRKLRGDKIDNEVN